MTQPNFGLALADFVSALQNRVNTEYAERYSNLTPPVVMTEAGSRYVRIVMDGTVNNGRGQRMAHSFVRKADGAILKTDGWKKPAKHVRGSIYAADNGMTAVTIYGANYLR